jgi:hypothetical protein
MFRLLLIALLAFAAWKGYEAYQSKKLATNAAQPSAPFARTSNPQAPAANFSCDGRKYCSQMTSCQEATYFLKNCPGVKMDGNNDGVPCEQQWCR